LSPISQAGSAFALTYRLLLRSCKLLGAFVISPLPPILLEPLQTAGPLGSTDVTPLPRYYGPLQDPLVFHRFPGCSSYTASLLRRFRDGTRRASPVALRVLAIVLSLLTPPEWIAASVRCDHPCCLRRTVAGSASGAIHFRGHICVHFRYGPMAHCHPKDDLVDRLQRFGFLPPCYPSYEASDFCPGGTHLPLNTPAFAGRTTGRERLHSYSSYGENRLRWCSQSASRLG